MSSLVTVKLPRNITDYDRHLFEPHLSYSLDDLKVLQLHEVFVSYSGFCLDENGLKRESHHAYPEKLQQFLDDATYHYSKAYNDPTNLIELDDDNIYLVVHHPWSSNYWHWMTEAIMRLWIVREDSKNMILILPEHLRSIEFINSSIKLFQFKNIYHLPFDKSLLVRNLCLPQIKPICDSYYAEALRAIRQHYSTFVTNNNVKNINLGDKIYISRKKASRRKVSNEEDVVGLLEKFGFVCITTEDYNFYEEIFLFSHVRYLISIHGSGLTNMLFMKDNASILELHKKRTNTNDWHSFAFWYLADALDLLYYHQLCEPEDSQSSIFDANYVIDLTLLEENVKGMLSQ